MNRVIAGTPCRLACPREHIENGLERGFRPALPIPQQRIVRAPAIEPRVSVTQAPEGDACHGIAMFEEDAEDVGVPLRELLLFHVGRGELEAEVDMAARELGSKVVRCPYLDPPTVFFRAVDALVLTSRYEGLPSVVLEALAADLPVITTLAPGVSHFADAGLSHFWGAPLDDPVALTNAIQMWLDDLPRERPSNHRSWVLERYSVENTLGLLLATYRAAVAG